MSVCIPLLMICVESSYVLSVCSVIIVDTRCSEAWPLITDDGGHSTLVWSEFMSGYKTLDMW